MQRIINVFQVARSIAFWFSPVILIVGLALLLAGNRYKKVDIALNKEVDKLTPKRKVPKLDDYNFSFNDSLLKNNTIVGLACVVIALVLFFICRR